MKYITSSLFSIGFLCIVIGIVLETTTYRPCNTTKDSTEPEIPGPELTTQYHTYPEAITHEGEGESESTLGLSAPPTPPQRTMSSLQAPPQSKVYAKVAFPTEKEP